jgi:hypothetical protein
MKNLDPEPGSDPDSQKISDLNPDPFSMNVDPRNVCT